jgi:hypothetical protein
VAGPHPGAQGIQALRAKGAAPCRPHEFPVETNALAGIAEDHKPRKGNDTAGCQRTEELHRVRNPGNPQAVNYQDRREQYGRPRRWRGGAKKSGPDWEIFLPAKTRLRYVQYLLRLLAAPNPQNRECSGKKRDPYDCQARIDFGSSSWSRRWRGMATWRWRRVATWSWRLSARCGAYPKRQYHCRNCVL